jgi:hypothetical protein
MAEDAGVEPGYTPQWMVRSMVAGCLIVGLGGLIVIAGAVLALLRPVRLTTRFQIAGGILGGLGFLITGGHAVALFSGYGLPEGDNVPEWVPNGINAGFLVMGLGALTAIAGTVLAARRPFHPGG